MLSDCNVRSYVDFQAWEFISVVTKYRLGADEMLVFAARPNEEIIGCRAFGT